jgi:hypothetical protein
MMKTFQNIVSLIIIATALFTACAGNRDQKLAEETVEKFHKLYNEQNYEEIFNSAHEEAKRLKSKEGLGFALAKTFEQYGKHLDSELVYTKISPVAGSNEKQVEFAYKSRFEKGSRNETFLIVTNDQKAALHSIGELTDDELGKLKSK